jgi:poly(3-hydroxybutyrate) depolymerase
MKFSLALLPILFFSLLTSTKRSDGIEQDLDPDPTYTIIVEGYDWGAAVSRVVVPLSKTVKIDKSAYTVAVKRSSKEYQLGANEMKGKRDIVFAYRSDASGNRLETGEFMTLVLSVGPDEILASPIQYLNGLNRWITYDLTVTHQASKRSWYQETGRLIPELDKFNLKGTFRHDDKLTMLYADYQPPVAKEKSPLIIWLHGGGEGGADPTIPLLANKAANYAAPEIQRVFGGAYVLVPQSPGAWMHNAEGVSTRGKDDDVYNQGLMALIRNYVDSHPGIDRDRIYVGGCSNGGYMSIKLLLLFPEYFAASFPSASAYNNEYITDAGIQSLKNTPIWLIHSQDDPVTPADKTATPLYKRLINAGAKNVHYSLYDHVIDLTGFFGGDDYYYLGHFSWIYSHRNHCRLDYDKKPVLVNGKEVTVMEWLAAQWR